MSRSDYPFGVLVVFCVFVVVDVVVVNSKCPKNFNSRMSFFSVLQIFDADEFDHQMAESRALYRKNKTL